MLNLLGNHVPHINASSAQLTEGRTGRIIHYVSRAENYTIFCGLLRFWDGSESAFDRADTETMDVAPRSKTAT
jgi:hypothetical protein